MTSRQVEGSDKTTDSDQKAVNSEKKALILWAVFSPQTRTVRKMYYGDYVQMRTVIRPKLVL